MARKKPTETQLTEQSVALAEFAAKALVAAEQLRIKKKAVKGFPLDETELAVAAGLPALSAMLKKKLAKKNAAFTIADTASIVMAVADALLEGKPLKRLALLFAAKKLIDCLEHNVVSASPKKDKASKPAATVFQFKITLIGVKPAIWRRIQVMDCTMDKLHEYIQTSMGWTNSHLHRFQIGEKRYADPMLMEEDMDEFAYVDSTTTMLSEIVPKKGRLRILYEYDFGDSWEHEVLLEGCPKREPGCKYPVCVEGERACPPEDVGGVEAYAKFLKTIQDKGDEEREAMLEWEGGWFDSEEFDPVTATKSMNKGLPDWRKMV